MIKLLIVPALVAAQFLTWAGGSLYMCVACDGSVAIDLGPGNCHRCHDHEQGADEHGHEHGCGCDHAIASKTHEHAVSPQAEGSHQASAPCDCEHVQITNEQSVTASRQSVVERALDHLLHAGALPVCLPAPLALATQLERCLSVAPSVEHSPQLRALGSIVLRC